MVLRDIINPISKEISFTLKSIFKDNAQATKAIMFSLKKNKFWSDEQRGLFSNTIYDMVRNWRLIWFLYGKEPSLNEDDLSELYKLYWCYKNNQYSKNPKIKARINEAFKIRRIKYSIPNWLDELGLKELGKKWEPVIKALNQKPDTIIRVNTLKNTKDELEDNLKKEKIKTENITYVSEALLIKNKTNLLFL